MDDVRLVKAVVEIELELEAGIHLKEQDIINVINEMDYDIVISDTDCVLMEKELIDCTVTIPEDTIKKLLFRMIENFDERNFQEIVKDVNSLQRFLSNNQEVLNIEMARLAPKFAPKQKRNIPRNTILEEKI